MNRRDAMLALFALGAAPFPALAQQQGKLWRIGFLGIASASGYVREIEAIRARLRDLGYVEGRTIAIEYRWAENSADCSDLTPVAFKTRYYCANAGAVVRF